MTLPWLHRARLTLRRHGGFGALSRRLARILGSEGLDGLRYRWRHLLHGDRGAATQRPAVSLAHFRANLAEVTNIRSSLSPGALLVGHPYAILGRAEDIRTAAQALHVAQVPFAMRNVLGDYGRQWNHLHPDFPLLGQIDVSSTFRANIHVLNANEMEMAWQHQGEALFLGPYNIGYWAWELSHFPDAWLPALALLDEIWAPSRFIQQAIAEKTALPVTWMPLAVEPTLASPGNRADLGLPDAPFLFLFLFDFRSYLSRKNPWAVIHAFKQAFSQSDPRVGLVIKTNGMEESQPAYQEFARSPLLDDPRIILIDRVMDDREIKSLVNHCDCFVSLHRAEGFGRGLAEAMFMGKPVIATGYSGNLDFMNSDNSCLVDYHLIPVGEHDYPFGSGQYWAEPDIGMAADWMRALASNPALAAEIGQAGAATIRRHHSFAAVGARYRRRLEQLHLL